MKTESAPAIVAEGVEKHYGKVAALAGVNLVVPRGRVVGLLGPNGAGKTTMVNILTTLTTMSAGRAMVDGIDVTGNPGRVREVIGLAGQYAAVDDILTGRENLELIGGLFHLSRSESARRATELLESFELVDAADRPSKTYSGGMRRRLDLAASLVHRPGILFLDEPTTGLDPRSRIALWDVIRGLVRQGTTLLLTTQYLEEADQLADEIVVIDHGRVIAAGTARELKDRVGGDMVHVVVAPAQIQSALTTIEQVSTGSIQVNQEDGELLIPAGSNGAQALIEILRRLDGAGIAIIDAGIRRPSLDDVFLTLTGHAAEE